VSIVILRKSCSRTGILRPKRSKIHENVPGRELLKGKGQIVNAIFLGGFAQSRDAKRPTGPLTFGDPKIRIDLPAQGKDKARTLRDVLCKRERCLGSLLNARCLALSIIKHAISFGLNLDGPRDNVLRNPLGFSNNIASRSTRVSYEALSLSQP
jgi:hypothetical protein